MVDWAKLMDNSHCIITGNTKTAHALVGLVCDALVTAVALQR